MHNQTDNAQCTTKIYTYYYYFSLCIILLYLRTLFPPLNL